MAKYNIDKFPECPDLRTDCFAFKEDCSGCVALVNTRFKNGKACPFYKPKIQVKRERLETHEKLKKKKRLTRAIDPLLYDDLD